MYIKRFIMALLCVTFLLQMGSTTLAAEDEDKSKPFCDLSMESEEFISEGHNTYEDSFLPKEFYLSTEITTVENSEHESNNTMATANVTYSDYNNRGTIQSLGDIDFWKVSLSKGHVNFWIEAPSNGQYYQYDVMDSTGSVIGRTSNTNKFMRFDLSAGTYYIKIYSTSSNAYPGISYLFRCKLYPYTATIMQGNTKKESDCLAAYNGLVNGGYKNIVTPGWSYIDETHSTILEDRVTEAEFVAAKNYDVAYYSGHGGSVSSKPAININATTTYGTYNVIKVADALGVSGDSWKSTAVWQPSDPIRVLILAACKQLTNTNAIYYARIMRASGIRAIAGYYGIGPGHETDTYIAKSFFEKAINETSVYGAWKEANKEHGNQPWAVLVYNENYNQYYRLPGYPGKTYTTPTSTAKVYLYSAQNTSGSSVLSNVVVDDDLPLSFSLKSVAQLASSIDNSREPVYTDEPLVDMADDAIIELSKSAGGVDVYGFPIRESTILRQELDEDGYVIPDSGIIVERVYTMHDVYRGVKIADSFVTVSYDSGGVNSVINRWKDIYNEYDVEINPYNSMQDAELICTADAVDLVEVYARNIHGEEPFEVYSTCLAYASAGEGVYELSYEVDTSLGVYYVSIQTGDIL